MGWRFSRRFKILPGVTLNLGKRGFTSVRIGPRRFGKTISAKGVRTTVSIPGTGLSHSTMKKFAAVPETRTPSIWTRSINMDKWILWGVVTVIGVTLVVVWWQTIFALIVLVLFLAIMKGGMKKAKTGRPRGRKY